MRNGYNCAMAGKELEDISKRVVLGPTGLDQDYINAWLLARMKASNGNFDEIQPVLHYGEYFQKKDQQFEATGRPGLLKATMAASNPDTVAVSDQLVDEFNADLPRIKEARDGTIIRAFVDRYLALQKPTEEATPK